ncbi:Crp/Fnr family transcriptional regulator [Sphingomonas edaphi]|jgi:CRP-like cAMP-binding protein|uniref:Crp/Fnr family transcriptional regulator n=1 Tax=Sphingomonas edaphi TaxID=2315689 RepID=A0A418Q157_9SPHN|nr:Crp/Fnr family transcriptional regulator [Sphingomonas edaphi]RIX31543.1 Crp/Fnr family transcriptional regulator [Sphingomonas edaphi]
MTIRRTRPSGDSGVSLRDRLIQAGLEEQYADMLVQMPHKVVQVEPRRPFREPGVARDEVMFVRSGILSKFKTDGSGRRQIVALRFPGDGILPREGAADYGIQAIVKSEVMVGRAEDFNELVEENPELARFFWKLIQRHNSIGYEWLVNTGRRDSTARVAHLLCETAERSGIDVRHDAMVNPFTQQQIADITGQTSVNVNRVFADLERQGLIKRRGREIQFTDWSELRRVASFQPGYLQ